MSEGRARARAAAAKSRGPRPGEMLPSPLGGLLVPLMLFLVLASCIALVQTSHKGRRMFSELQDLRGEAMQLEEEWGRLLLEESTWASPDRVQRLAKKELNMQAPDMREVIMVKGYGKAN